APDDDRVGAPGQSLVGCDRIDARPHTGLLSVRLADEDERRSGHDRRAGADKADIGVLDLARAGAARGLQRALDDVPEAVDAAGAEAAAEGVEREVAVQLDA